MKYLTNKAVLALFAIYGVFAQSTIDPEDSRWGWDDYTELVCDQGYNKVQNFCVRCNQDSGKFFDPVTKQCRQCPEGTIFNAQEKSCQCPCEPPRQVNPQTNECQCSGGRQFLNESCQCPDGYPLWNGRKCVRCPEGTTYEPKDRQCYHCPQGFQADPVTHHCIPALGH